MNQYEDSKCWITKILESEKPFKIKNPFISSVVKFGLIPDFFLILLLIYRYEYLTTEYMAAYVIAWIWLNIGPYLIWYYDEKVLPKFFSDSIELVPDQEKLNKFASKWDNFFASKYSYFGIPWTIIILIIVFLSLTDLPINSGIFGIEDPFYWLILVFGAIEAGVLMSIAFVGILTTILSIDELSKENLKIDPFHPDKLGGLSVFGEYAISTTLLASTGSFFLPIALELFLNSRMATPIIYFTVAIFCFVILLSFLYPTYRINNKADLIRTAILEDLRKKYYHYKKSIDEKNHGNDLSYYLELEKLRNEYQDYSAVKLYPFEIEILIKLASSVILPILFLLIQDYLGML